MLACLLHGMDSKLHIRTSGGEGHGMNNTFIIIECDPVCAVTLVT